jgi:hypothetical protein
LAVHVEIAPDTDFIFAAYSQIEKVDGFLDIGKLRGWILFGIQKRLNLDGGVDSAPEESLCDEGGQAQGLERGGDFYGMRVKPASHKLILSRSVFAE